MKKSRNITDLHPTLHDSDEEKAGSDAAGIHETGPEHLPPSGPRILEMWEVRTFQTFGTWLVGTGILAPQYTQETLFWNALIVSLLIGETGLTSLNPRSLEGLASILLAAWLAFSAACAFFIPPQTWMANQIVIGVLSFVLGTHLYVKVLAARGELKKLTPLVELRKYLAGSR